MKDGMVGAILKSKAMGCAKKRWRGGYAGGGIVAPDQQDDDLHVTGHLNTSGEPHTEDLDEVEHPMEFMDDDDDVGAPEFGAKFFHALKYRPRRMGA